MKKVILLPALVCALMATYTVSAQNNNANKNQGPPSQPGERPADPHQKAQESAEKATKRYGLNTEQKNRWQGAAMQRNMERMNLKMQMQGETTPEQRKDIRAQAKKQNEQFDANVKQFLTPEQYTKYTKDREEHEKKRKAAAKNKKPNDKEIHEMEAL